MPAPTVLAGDPVIDGYHDDIDPLAARFDLPTDVVDDGTGTLYITDMDNDAVRLMSPGGVVGTVDQGHPEIDRPLAIDIGGGYLWVICDSSSSSATGLVRINGGTDVMRAVSAADTPQGVAADDTYAAFTRLVAGDNSEIVEIEHDGSASGTYIYSDDTEDVQDMASMGGYFWAIRRALEGHDLELHRFTPGDITTGPTRITVPDLDDLNYIGESGGGLLASNGDGVFQLNFDAGYGASPSVETIWVRAGGEPFPLGTARSKRHGLVFAAGHALYRVPLDEGWDIGHVGWPN